MSEIQQLLQRGKEAFAQRDYGAALTDFQEVLRRNPRFADIHHMTGLCLSYLGYPEAALQEFTEAIAVNARYIEAHVSRAITLNELGRFEEARQAFEQAAEFETRTPGEYPAAITARLANAHAHVGDLYAAAGSHEKAIDQYRSAINLRTQFHDIRNKLAESLMEVGRLSEAAVELQTILDINPRFLSARLNLGLVYYRLGDNELAAREWESAAEFQPDHPQVRAYLGLIGRSQGETESSL